jgi:inosine/xanthosine triphosphate pyrophosphatase family protein
MSVSVCAFLRAHARSCLSIFFLVHTDPLPSPSPSPHAHLSHRYAQCIFSYCEGPGSEPLTFVGRSEGRIVPARGPTDFGWDPVFEAEGFGKTFAQMTKEEKNSVSHRGRSLEKLRAFLCSQS